MPSHSFSRQSPGVCSEVGVPGAVLFTPHALVMQVRTWQSVSEPGHCVLTLQATQVPVPEQNEPPCWVHVAVVPNGGCIGLPALHVSDVHWLPSSAGTSLSSTTFVTLPLPSHCF